MAEKNGNSFLFGDKPFGKLLPGVTWEAMFVSNEKATLGNIIRKRTKTNFSA